MDLSGSAPEPCLQHAALCYRVIKHRPQILLITSRDTGRWLLPKGWPIPGLTPEQSAEQEAFEEAGVKGVASADSLGTYPYYKLIPPDRLVPCTVSVYPLRVLRVHKHFPEHRQRERKWLAPDAARALVQEPGLQEIIALFAAAIAPVVAAKPGKSAVRKGNG